MVYIQLVKILFQSATLTW